MTRACEPDRAAARPRAARHVSGLRGGGTADLRRAAGVALDARLALPAGTPLGLADGPPEPLLQLEWCAPFSGTRPPGAPRAQVRGRAPARRAARRGRGRRAGAGAGAGGDAVRARSRSTRRGGASAATTRPSSSRPRPPAALRAAVGAGARADPRHDRPVPARPAAPGGQRRATRSVVRRGRASERSRGRWVVLVDDVVTTGATLGAAAAALLDAGALAVSAITVARER